MDQPSGRLSLSVFGVTTGTAITRQRDTESHHWMMKDDLGMSLFSSYAGMFSWSDCPKACLTGPALYAARIESVKLAMEYLQDSLRAFSASKIPDTHANAKHGMLLFVTQAHFAHFCSQNKLDPKIVQQDDSDPIIDYRLAVLLLDMSTFEDEFSGLYERLGYTLDALREYVVL